MDKFLKRPLLEETGPQCNKLNQSLHQNLQLQEIFVGQQQISFIDRCCEVTQNTVKECLMLDLLFPVGTTSTVGSNTRKKVMLSSAFDFRRKVVSI